MNILIYYQNSSRTIFLESIAQNFIEQGHNVFFLTISQEGVLHDKMREMGVIVSAHSLNKKNRTNFLNHWRFLIQYCRRNHISVVFSHLQFVNFIAILAQYFIKAKVFPCRHHVDEVLLIGNKNGLLVDKLVNKLAKKIIVVSNKAKQQMEKHENVKESKIIVIPLGYNFSLYDKPDLFKVSAIRKKMQCHLLLIIIARMAPNKRHIIGLQVLNKLINEGLDVKMLLLDHGAEEIKLKEFVKVNGLDEKVLFTGFLDNTMDYVAAADLVVHPSIIESSNQVVKEAGILDKPSIVCSGIGDFDEYFIHRKNGFLVSQENACEEMHALIKEYYYKKDELKAIGENMKKEVLSRFNVKNISEDYRRLLN